MPSHPGNDPDSVRLSDDSAAALLARATQLDAARLANTSVAELRRAALDAGIAPEAFEQALSELRAAAAVPDVRPAEGRRRRLYRVVGIALVVGLFLAYMLLRVFPG
jgi:hypothetical protein